MKKLFFIVFFLILTFPIVGQVTAEFDTDQTSGCAPFVVPFTNLSTDGNSYKWDFGNGFTSTDLDPIYIYSQPGIYTVTLITTNGTDSDTTKKSALIRVNASPVPKLSVNSQNGCSPHIAEFSDLSIPQSGTITEWYWAFGNGETSSEQNPTTTYIETKNYEVFLKVKDINGCEASISKSDFIRLDNPQAKFVHGSVKCGLPSPVTFINKSTGEDLDYNWDFGDGNSTSGDVPGIHEYIAFGTKQVTLTVTEKLTGCKDTYSKSLVVGDYEATFDWDIICGFNEFTIKVENTTETFNSLDWNFGGESTKSTQNAEYNFKGKGPYEITLTSTVNDACWDTTTITYQLPEPIANGIPPICSDPLEVTFTNNSKGSELDYYWDFGDSLYSTEKSPVHTYDIPPEIFKYKLVATDKFGCSDTNAWILRVPFPIARFYEQDSIYTGCSPLNLTFKDTSYTLNSKISNVEWNFGDPASESLNESKEFEPNHIYNTPGDYDIKYIIFTEDGCSDTVTYEAIIKAGEKPISANFTQSPNDTICYGDRIDFEDQANYLTTYLESNYFCWAFNEGTNSLLIDEETPISDCPPNVSSYLGKTPFINYNDPSRTYEQFKHVSDTIGDTISTGEVIPDAGQLYTHLITGYNGCFVEVINPTFVDTTIAVNGYVIEDNFELFSDSSKFFGFYQASLNYDSIAYSYIYSASARTDTVYKIHPTDTSFFLLTEGEKYYVRTKILNNASGCENELYDQIVIDSVRLDFEVVKRQCLNSNPVLFDDNSHAKYGKLIERNWLINGVKELSSLDFDSAYYSFPDTGTFKITLQNIYQIEYYKYGVKTYGDYTKELTKQIKIEGVKAKGSSDTLNICGGETLEFTDSSGSTNLIKDYVWQFGYETDSATIQNPSHIYNLAGTYTPTLIVTDTFGCYDSVALTPISVSKPTVNFIVSDSLICKGDFISMINESINYPVENSLSYTWTAYSFTSNNIDFVQQFDSVGSFDIKLHAIDNTSGCQDSLIKTKHLEVSDFPETNFAGSPLYVDCPPLASNFGDSTKTNVLSWNWNFGDGNTSSSQNPINIFTSPGLFDISLITTNFAGCSDTLIRKEYVNINGPSGYVNFNPDTLCIPDSVKFDLELNNTQFYIWNFGDGNNISYNYEDFPDSIFHHYKKGGTFQPTIELIDDEGCFYSLPELPIIQGDSIKAQFMTSSDIICDVLNIPFQNNSRSTFESEFLWTFGDLDSSKVKSPLHTYLTDSIYSVTLKQKSPLGCIDSVSKTITVFNAPLPKLNIQNENFCIPSISILKLIFENNQFVADSSFFTLENSKIMGDSIVYQFENDGINNIQFTIAYGSGNCVIDSIVATPFYKWPIADFEFSPKNNSTEEPDVIFKNKTQNASEWLWDFNDDETSSEESPGNSFKEAGSYKVKLIGSNAGGCSDTVIKDVNIAPYDFIKVPSAFSPNGDGQNDLFGILRAGDFTILEFKIYNRWGNIVFESNNVNDKWDGTKKGSPQNTGTYIYYIKGSRTSGKQIEIKGDFTLLR
ncbi:MAG: PKD domain-containing protein [Flavobacteriales bacterium]|nr:PKD domain-containing protein [Flavobacteriales bacterium]